MLKQRIITALALLLVLLPALFASRYEYFAAFALLAVVVAVWEWARLLHISFIGSCVWAAAVGLVCVVVWFRGFDAQIVQPLLWISLALWAVALGSTLPQARMPSFLVQGGGRYVHLLFAACAAVSVWTVLVLAKQRGALFVLSMLALVWAADIAAYFVGKGFGKHKLAPNISPGKTWEGAIGGVAGAVILAIACHAWSNTFFEALSEGSWLRAALFTAVLAALSIAGDLYESLLKRQAGAKDSSRLLPGHGGVLDRVDALLPTLPLAWLML